MIIHHMSGAGNRFVLIDDRQEPCNEGLPFSDHQVRELLQLHGRPDAAPVEGLLRIREIQTSAITVEFYNPDGSRGMLCGNGARCSIRYAIDNGASPVGWIECTFNGITYTARQYDDQTIGLRMPTPTQMRFYPVGSLDGVDVPIWYVDVHSDHVVLDAAHDASNPLVLRLRHHPDFPRGVNVNLLQVSDPAALQLATFERGVEAITQACGTGAVSAAVTMWMRNPSVENFSIIPPSGRPLMVTIFAHGGHIDSIELRGDALYDD